MTTEYEWNLERLPRRRRSWTLVVVGLVIATLWRLR